MEQIKWAKSSGIKKEQIKKKKKTGKIMRKNKQIKKKEKNTMEEKIRRK